MAAMSRPMRRESAIRACCGGGSSRPSLRIAKFANCQSMSKPRAMAAVLSQRAVFHE
jgi:hypothetical protein